MGDKRGFSIIPIIVVVAAFLIIGGIVYYRRTHMRSNAAVNASSSTSDASLATLSMPPNDPAATGTFSGPSNRDDFTLSPTSGPAPLTVTATYLDYDEGSDVNWGDGASDGLGGGPLGPSNTSTTITEKHIYRTEGAYAVQFSGFSTESTTVNVTDSASSVSPMIFSPSAGQVYTIGTILPVSWQGIDGAYRMSDAFVDTSTVQGDYVELQLWSLLGYSLEGHWDAGWSGRGGYEDFFNTGSYQWDTKNVLPGEYDLQIGGPDSDGIFIDNIWFIPPGSASTTPTISSIDVPAYVAWNPDRRTVTYNVIVHGNNFTPASYVYTEQGTVMPSEVSADGASLTISIPGNTYETSSIQVFNGTHGSNETSTPPFPAPPLAPSSN